MPVRPVTSTERPTYQEKPDIRFATTFLSHEFRDYAVEGEVLMDKMTGELFIKRPVDGRVLSYDQNKKYLYDLMLELRVLLSNNQEFTYPKSDDINAYYVSTNYDLVTINKDIPNNIFDNNTIIPELSNNVDLLNTLSFNVSGKCNGFFCRPTTRDSDKLIVEVLTNLYNNLVKNYQGTDSTIKTEASKFNTIEKWYDSNVVLEYTLEIENNGSTQSYSCEDYVRFNEECCVLFPSKIMNKYQSGFTSAKVTINKLRYDKIHFLKTLTDDILGVNLMDYIQDYACLDEQIYVNYINITYFVNKYADIKLLGNDVVIGCADTSYVERFMKKMSRIRDKAEFIQTTERPDFSEWGANAVWAEIVRDAYENGVLDYHNSETDIRELETYLAKKNYNVTDQLIISTNIEDLNDIYLKDTEADDVLPIIEEGDEPNV